MALLKQFKKGIPVKITKSFVSTEFDCKCKNSDCQWTTIDVDHIAKLQTKRDKWGVPVEVESGYRCPKHNAAEGGATNSRHPQGDATDIKVKGLSPQQVSADCEDFNGKGVYDTFVHIDSRPLGGKPKARWDFRTKK